MDDSEIMLLERKAKGKLCTINVNQIYAYYATWANHYDLPNWEPKKDLAISDRDVFKVLFIRPHLEFPEITLVAVRHTRYNYERIVDINGIHLLERDEP